MKKTDGTEAMFIYRGWGQNSLQSTTEKPFNQKPLIIPRTGTSALLGFPTLIDKPIPQEK